MRPFSPEQRRLFLLLVGIAVIYVYGIAGYLLFGYGLIDSFYMTTLSLTTVGFTPEPEFTSAAKVFTVTISLLGVSAFLAFLALLVQAFAEGQLSSGTRRRRMDKKIDRLKDHYIVCAYGRVGRAVSREFEAEGVPFVVIESKEELEEQMRGDGALYMSGDPTSDRVLRQAGVERARGLVCAVDSDTANVYITLTARSINPKIFVVARAAETGSADLLNKAGADRVISPYVTSGRQMALVALRPRVIDSLDVFGRGDLRLDELIVDAGSKLVGMSLEQACGSAVPLLLRRKSGELESHPAGNSRLQAGDMILLLGDSAQLKRVEEG